jgi:hypothetical protein
MSLSRPKRKGWPPIASMAGVVSLSVGMFLAAAFQSPIRANQDASTDQRAPVLKGKEPVEITGTVVAMSREPWMFPYFSFHILLLRVEKVLSRGKTERYVRAEFPSNYVYTDSKEAKGFRLLASSLHERKTWKILLIPPHGRWECLRLPPPPTPGDLMSAYNPVILPVGGASGYPDINTVPCYVFEEKDIQEIGSPEKAK